MDDKDVLRITSAIKQGASKILPASLRSKTKIIDASGCSVISETQILEDIVQAVWVKLLETNEVNTKIALSEGMSHARDWCRKELKTIPISQMSLKVVEEDGCEPEELLPWDQVDLSKQAAIPDAVYQVLGDIEDSERKRVFQSMNQADRRFLARYVAKNRGHNAQQWKRFQRLTELMKKLLTK